MALEHWREVAGLRLRRAPRFLPGCARGGEGVGHVSQVAFAMVPSSLRPDTGSMRWTIIGPVVVAVLMAHGAGEGKPAGLSPVKWKLTVSKVEEGAKPTAVAVKSKGSVPVSQAGWTCTYQLTKERDASKNRRSEDVHVKCVSEAGHSVTSMAACSYPDDPNAPSDLPMAQLANFTLGSPGTDQQTLVYALCELRAP